MKSEMFANRPDRKADEEVDSWFKAIFKEEYSWAPKLAVPIAVKVGTSEIPNVSYSKIFPSILITFRILPHLGKYQRSKITNFISIFLARATSPMRLDHSTRLHYTRQAQWERIIRFRFQNFSIHIDNFSYFATLG